MNNSTQQEDQQLSKIKVIKANRKAKTDEKALDGGTEILNHISEFLLNINYTYNF